MNVTEFIHFSVIQLVLYVKFKKEACSHDSACKIRIAGVSNVTFRTSYVYLLFAVLQICIHKCWLIKFQLIQISSVVFVIRFSLVFDEKLTF